MPLVFIYLPLCQSFPLFSAKVEYFTRKSHKYSSSRRFQNKLSETSSDRPNRPSGDTRKITHPCMQQTKIHTPDEIGMQHPVASALRTATTAHKLPENKCGDSDVAVLSMSGGVRCRGRPRGLTRTTGSRQLLCVSQNACQWRIFWREICKHEPKMNLLFGESQAREGRVPNIMTHYFWGQEEKIQLYQFLCICHDWRGLSI